MARVHPQHSFDLALEDVDDVDDLELGSGVDSTITNVVRDGGGFSAVMPLAHAIPTSVVDEKSEKDGKPLVGERSERKVTYYTIVWWFYWITSILYVFDRFVTNVFPRQSFKIEKGFSAVTGEFSGYGTSKDKVDGFLADGDKGGDGPVLALLFDVLARLSGRMIVTATNLCFFTMTHTFHQFLSAHAPSWLDMHDVEIGMRRLHMSGGIQCIIFTIPHIFSCFWMNVFSGYHLKFKPGPVDIPGTERHDYATVDIETQTVTLGVDDIWRQFLMVGILLILLPWSYVLFHRRWDIGIKMHLFVAIMYFWDNVRRHSHPHAWIFNGPLFCFWVADKIIGMRWKKIEGLVSHAIPLGQEHLAVFVQALPVDQISSLWYLHAKGSSGRSHPFTTAQNRCVKSAPLAAYQIDDIGSEYHAFPIRKQYAWAPNEAVSGDLKMHASASRQMRDAPNTFEYSNMFVIGISQRPGAWTGNLLQKLSSETLIGWGAFHSPYYRIHDELKEGTSPVMVVGSGSGSALVLDVVDYLCSHGSACAVRVVYTARDPCLFQFVCDMLHEKINAISDKLPLSLQIQVALTGKHGVGAASSLTESKSIMRAQVGRFDFQSWVDAALEDSHLFFCGSPVLGTLLQMSCALKNECESGPHVVMQGYHSFGGPTKKDIETNLLEARATGLITNDTDLSKLRCSILSGGSANSMSEPLPYPRQSTVSRTATSVRKTISKTISKNSVRKSIEAAVLSSNKLDRDRLRQSYTCVDF